MVEISQKVDKTIINYINEVQKHLNINKAILYGSYAKGNYNVDSDVDIAFFFHSFKGKSLIEINTFLFSLARKFNNICIEPIGFDCSELSKENSFVKEIMETGKEIYSDNQSTS